MRNALGRRSVILGATSALALATVGCSAVQTLPTYEGDASQGPVLVFDDAVARPKGAESFLNDLGGEKLKFFDRIFFVNKSPFGVYSQTLKILAPDKTGVENSIWRVKGTFDVSTGRELQERYFTTTPRGIFTFDKHRRHRDYNSRQWDGSSMPFAMFWDYIYPNGRPTGIAFHSTTEETEKFLGIRASGGCIRLSMAESEQVFDMVGQLAGPVPDFLDRDPRAVLQYDADGNVEMKDGFRVLVVVEENQNIEWEPFVRSEIWVNRVKRNRGVAVSGSYFTEEMMIAAGQN